MTDKMLSSLFLFAIIFVAMSAICIFSGSRVERIGMYGVDAIVTQANKPISPTDALAQTSKRINGTSSSTWPVIAITTITLIVVVLIPLALHYGQGFLKQLRLTTKKSKAKPRRLREIPTQSSRELTRYDPDQIMIEGEAWENQ